MEFNVDKDDATFMVELAAGTCSLDRKAGSNWVQEAGGLPNYICQIARAIHRDGKSISSSIAIAVSRVKAWAAGGGDVDAKTRAKAAKAVAAWEALKKRAKSGSAVRATRSDGSPYIMLSNIDSFNTDLVRIAWSAQEREARNAARATLRSDPGYDYDSVAEAVPYTYIKELWTDYIIVEQQEGSSPGLYKVPYTVSGNDVTFGDKEEVKVEYVAASAEEPLTANELQLLGDLISPLDRVIGLSNTIK